MCWAVASTSRRPSHAALLLFLLFAELAANAERQAKLGNSGQQLRKLSEGIQQHQNLAAGQSDRGQSQKVRAGVKPLTEVEEHVAFPGEEVCGGPWPQLYSSLHQKIRKKLIPPKFLTFKPVPNGPGFGDRLNGIVSAFLTALLLQRALIIDDKDVAGSFLPNLVDWRATKDVPLAVNAKRFKDVKEGSVLLMNAANSVSGAWAHCQKCHGMQWDILKHFHGTQAASNIVLQNNRGILIKIFRNVHNSTTSQALHATGLRLPNAFGCIIRFLMRPKPEILKAASGTLARLRSPDSWSICVHIRTTDKLAWGKHDLHGRSREARVARKLIASMVACAEEVERFWVPGGEECTWFIMSDSEKLRKQLRTLHPEKVLLSQLLPVHSGHGDSFKPLVAEWLAFSSCDFYVLVQSGLSKTAYAFNLKAPPVYLYQRADWPAFASGLKDVCDPWNPSSLLSLEGWSGI